jgi:hypothetical protein
MRKDMVAATVVGVLMMVGAALAQVSQLRHWSGQAVAPVYGGFDIKPDGSYDDAELKQLVEERKTKQAHTSTANEPAVIASRTPRDRVRPSSGLALWTPSPF